MLINEKQLRCMIRNILRERFGDEDDRPYYEAESSVVLVLSNTENPELVDVQNKFPADYDTESYIYVVISTKDFYGTYYKYNDGDRYNPPIEDFESGEWGGQYKIDEIIGDGEIDYEADEQFMNNLDNLIKMNRKEIGGDLEYYAELIQECGKKRKTIKEDARNIHPSMNKAFDKPYPLFDGFCVTWIGIDYYPSEDKYGDYATGEIELIDSKNNNFGLYTDFGIRPLTNGFDARNTRLGKFNLSNEEKQIFRDFIVKCLNDNKIQLNEGFDDSDSMVREMILWLENTYSLYERRQYLVTALTKKIKKGENVTVERLAKSRVMEQLLHDTMADYARNFGNFTIPTEVRKQIKWEMSERIIEDAENEVNRY